MGATLNINGWRDRSVRWLQSDYLCAIIAIVGASLFAAAHLETGWIPHDEGQLGQAAERVLQGQMPHRDFDDMYTGGLTYLHALAFKLMGIRTEATRWMLWMFFVPFTAGVYWIARRVEGPWPAVLVTMLCGAMTTPVLGGALPSWYNLFLAVYALVCLLKFLDTGRRIWLLAAGLIIGCTLLLKVTGLYLLAAAMLFLVRYEQLLKSASRADSIAFKSFVLACLGLFGCLGLMFSLTADWLMSSLHLTLPLILLTAYTAWSEFQVRRGPFAVRLKRLLSFQLPLLVGAFLPVAAYVVFYWQAGAVHQLVEGVLVLPKQRVAHASYPFPPLGCFVCSLPIAAVLLAGFSRRLNLGRLSVPVCVVCLLLAIVLWYTPLGFNLTFHAVRNLGPYLALIAVGMLWTARGRRWSRRDRSQLYLLCAMMTLGSLVQFPYAIGFYFLYAAPLVFLCGLYVLAGQPNPQRRLMGHLATMFLLFIALRMTSFSPLANIRGGLPGQIPSQALGLQRCSLTVEEYMATNYRRLVDEIQQRTQPGDYILAGPDFPEAYFLSQTRNPSRVFYDIFRPDFQDDLASLDSLLAEHDVRVVALKLAPEFSPLQPKFVEFIRQRYPGSKNISCIGPDGRPCDPKFAIYWHN